MKGSKEWSLAKQVKLLPPKARRMPGRPKKHRRREADEVGGGCRLSKKGVVMKCSRCLVIGHNKATCKATEAEAVENHRKADEARKAQAEAARAHSLRSKQNVRKKTTQTARAQSSTGVGQAKKRGRPPKAKQINQQHPTPTSSQQPRTDQSSPQAPSTQEVPTEAAQKKRRGRPPKTSNTQVQTRKMPAGMGVFTGDDGHTYMSSSRSTIRFTDLEPNTTTI
ncbi:hypothetical protein POM88_039274 [Heracleum sosnowskyi]|uniref:Uncharacterized protein n=1 Tax=Heracleum sosnowskyi TaxID=360622 RepID=A0AAD8HBZ1_9APIA|nr:hypothetical protein POM88_039274 [Heracleum sosnowskyi]